MHSDHIVIPTHMLFRATLGLFDANDIRTKPHNWSHSVTVWNYVLKDMYVSKSPVMKSIIKKSVLKVFKAEHFPFYLRYYYYIW